MFVVSKRSPRALTCFDCMTHGSPKLRSSGKPFDRPWLAPSPPARSPQPDSSDTHKPSQNSVRYTARVLKTNTADRTCEGLQVANELYLFCVINEYGSARRVRELLMLQLAASSCSLPVTRSHGAQKGGASAVVTFVCFLRVVLLLSQSVVERTRRTRARQGGESAWIREVSFQQKNSSSCVLI